MRVCIAAIAGLFALAGAQSAFATTYCVDDPTCVRLGGEARPTLTAAVDAANANSNADRIELGAGTFPGGQRATEPVAVVGEGSDDTTIFGSSSGPVFTLAEDGPSSISDVEIGLDTDDGTGLSLAGSPHSASAILVSGDPSDSGSETGVNMDGSTLTHSRVSMPTDQDANTTGLLGGPSGSINVARTQIEAENAAMVGAGTLRRMTATGSTSVIRAFSGHLTLDQALVRLTGNGVALEAAASTSFGGIAPSLTARHVTAVGNGVGTGARAINLGADCSSAEVLVALRSSILRGFATDRARTGSSCLGPPGPDGFPTSVSKPARIDTTYSIFEPAKSAFSGNGSFSENGTTIADASLGTTNSNADPRFAGLNDFHLGSGSPAIDAGDPASPGGGESVVDLDGNARTTDGNGDGTARRDIGAYEAAAVPFSGTDGGGTGGDGGGTGGDGGGLGGGTVTDSTAPVLTLGGRARQRADGVIEVDGSCDEACVLAGDGSVKAKPSRRGAAARGKAKTFGLGEDGATLAAGEKATLELKVGKKAARSIARFLRSGGKASAVVQVTATDASGNSTGSERRVKLKPKK